MPRLNGNGSRLLAIIMAVGMAVSLTFALTQRGASAKAECNSTDIAKIKEDQAAKHGALDQWVKSVDESLKDINRKLDRLDRR